MDFNNLAFIYWLLVLGKVLVSVDISCISREFRFENLKWKNYFKYASEIILNIFNFSMIIIICRCIQEQWEVHALIGGGIIVIELYRNKNNLGWFVKLLGLTIALNDWKMGILALMACFTLVLGNNPLIVSKTIGKIHLVSYPELISGLVIGGLVGLYSLFISISIGRVSFKVFFILYFRN